VVLLQEQQGEIDDLREKLRIFEGAADDRIRVGRGTRADWEAAPLSQDRLRGEAVAKLLKIRGILGRDDVGSFSSRELLDEIEAVLDGE
jgi:hypothetical protein